MVVGSQATEGFSSQARRAWLRARPWGARRRDQARGASRPMAQHVAQKQASPAPNRCGPDLRAGLKESLFSCLKSWLSSSCQYGLTSSCNDSSAPGGSVDTD